MIAHANCRFLRGSIVASLAGWAALLASVQGVLFAQAASTVTIEKGATRAAAKRATAERRSRRAALSPGKVKAARG